MVDRKERNRLLQEISMLLANPNSWDSYSQYYARMNTYDLALYGVGRFFWICFDPEFPLNRLSLHEEIIFRCILFLMSSEEYKKPRDQLQNNWWPFSGKCTYDVACQTSGCSAMALLKIIADYKYRSKNTSEDR